MNSIDTGNSKQSSDDTPKLVLAVYWTEGEKEDGYTCMNWCSFSNSS